ncbi:DUF3048 domain-containing protein [Microbacterium deminutum]|uniref:DUF3048 domain-containing protein n=1 Tax=Microbacterium deminutum TaxID=344164 RepID=A0ABN2RBY2_9MICO
MPSPRRRAASIAVLAVGAALLAACSAPAAASPSASATPTPSVTATATPSRTPTPQPPATAISPLRGTEVLASTITGPALSAKVDDHWDARPQWGLEHTDLVFEELVEGGITRYVAVWFSDVPAEIGPVRSIRPMDPDIVTSLGGIVAYSGGQQRFVDMMLDTPVHNAIHGGADDRFMYRTAAKAAPHNVIVKAQELRAAYASIPPPQQFAYTSIPRAASAASYGTPASRIDVRFASGTARSWTWDAASGAYLRAQDGAADLDAEGARLKATNVVAMSVGIDWSYGIIPRTIMIGSGPAWISTGGRTLQATWTKTSRESPIRLTDQHGVPISLAPGNTWIELVPNTQPVTVVP